MPNFFFRDLLTFNIGRHQHFFIKFYFYKILIILIQNSIVFELNSGFKGWIPPKLELHLKYVSGHALNIKCISYTNVLLRTFMHIVHCTKRFQPRSIRSVERFEILDKSLFRLLYLSTSTVQRLEISRVQNLEISRRCTIEVDE